MESEREFEARCEALAAARPDDSPDDTPDDSAGEEEQTQRAADARIIADAKAHQGLRPLEQRPRQIYERKDARLPDTAGAPQMPASGDGPASMESELIALVGECRYFMREIAFQSARLVPSAADRINFLDAACRLAHTGAAVGKVAAKLRPKAAAREERRRMVFEHIHVARDHAALPPGPATGQGGDE